MFGRSPYPDQSNDRIGWQEIITILLLISMAAIVLNVAFGKPTVQALPTAKPPVIVTQVP